jgi:hypothetical protein
METYTIPLFIVALIAGLALMPTNVYKVCAWNVGFAKAEPWRQRAAAAMRDAAQAVRTWFAMAFNWQTVFVCAAILALIAAYQTASHHQGVLLAIAPVAVAPLKEKRAELVKKAEALHKDGTFADDAARAAFDGHMTEVRQLDEQIRPATSRRCSRTRSTRCCRRQYATQPDTWRKFCHIEHGRRLPGRPNPRYRMGQLHACSTA